MHPTIVIGGGIAGLACAYRLQSRGRPVLLLEQSERTGGVIQSIRRDGFLFDLGPQSFLSTEPLLQFISELGLEDQLVKADPRAPRYVLLEGTPRHVKVDLLVGKIRALDSRILAVEDLHVWEITSRMYAATAEVKVQAMSLAEAEGLRQRMNECLRTEFGIAHVVLALIPA